VLVDFQWTPPTLSESAYVASLLYDRTTGQAASWKYVITWPARAVDSSGSTAGWTTARPQVSWGVANPVHSPGSADYVPALFCRADPGDLTQRTVSELAALLPTMPADCATTGTPANTTGNGPFCKAAYAHPSVYPLGGTARCVSQQGFAAGAGNVLFRGPSSSTKPTRT
jgi:hypothetical protein